MVVDSCIAGVVLFFTVVVEVVVVVGVTGFSTTVVHEVNSMATAKSGVRMISFFIVGVVFLHKPIATDASTRCVSTTLFENFISLILPAGTQPLCARPPAFRFQDALLQTTRARPSLPANLFPTIFFRGNFVLGLSIDELRETFSRQFAVLRLRSGILDGNAEAGRQMTERHGR